MTKPTPIHTPSVAPFPKASGNVSGTPVPTHPIIEPAPLNQAPIIPGSQAQLETTALTTSTQAPDLSMWGMFWGAELTVQVVMLMLLLASFWCWTIIIDKLMRIRKLCSQAEAFEDTFWSGGSLDSLFDRVGSRPQDPMTAVFAAGMREWRRSLAKGLATTTEIKTTLQQRIERIMQVTVTREMEQLERHMGFLASVGSTAPFIGLFGTVWGIMHSFQGIAASKSTNLAVVAPGIAEALLATALGLIAAIPAVIAYNKISNDLNRYANRLDSFANEFTAIISHQLEETDQ